MTARRRRFGPRHFRLDYVSCDPVGILSGPGDPQVIDTQWK